MQKFLNAEHPEEIIFVRNATEGVNLVAQTFGRQNVGEGDEIMISAMEHHSNIVPWQMLCEEKGARLRVIPINDSGELLLDEYEKLLTPRTKLVGIVHMSNALGTVNPVARSIGRRTRTAFRSWWTAAQSAYHLPRRRAGAGLRLLRLLRPQALRADRYRRSLRQEALLEAMPP